MTEPKQKPGSSRQDYGTPPELLAAVKRRLRIDDFGMDLAADAANRVTQRYYDRHDDALAQPWPQPRWNWLNPPYSRIGPWVQKAYRTSQWENNQTAVLIPAAVGSIWWREFVHEKCRVLFLNPRLTFVGCTDPYPKDCALLLYSLGYSGYDVWTWKAPRTSGTVSAADSAEILSSSEGKAMGCARETS